VVQRAPGGPRDVTPAGFDVRTLVHEYGGGAWAARGGAVFFANFEDQRVWRQDEAGAPRPLTAAPPAPRSVRYADLEVDAALEWVYCVRETHAPGREAANELSGCAPTAPARPSCS
jgi:hypothetical protein